MRSNQITTSTTIATVIAAYYRSVLLFADTHTRLS